MPLTGQAKKDWQREYMRDYMRNRRAGITVKTQPNQGITVKTQAESVKTVTPIMLRPVSVTPRHNSKVDQRSTIQEARPAGGSCQFCGVKLPAIATCCNTCAREHDG